MDGVVDGIIDAILDGLRDAYHGPDAITPTREDLIVTEASGPAGPDYKFSFHIVVAPYAVANNEEAKGFTARVLQQLPAAFRGFVDVQVNKSLQNFRLTGSSKPGSTRVKRVTARFGTGDPPREATVIRAQPGARILSRMCVPGDDRGDEYARVPEISDEDLLAVSEILARTGASAAHSFWRARGGLLLFRRLRPGHCAICGRVHDKDNTLMVAAVPVEDAPGSDPAKAAHQIVEHCRHNSETRVLGVVALTRRCLSTLPGPAPRDTGSRLAAPRRSDLAIRARVAAISREPLTFTWPTRRSRNGPLPAPVRGAWMRAYEAVPTSPSRAR